MNSAFSASWYTTTTLSVVEMNIIKQLCSKLQLLGLGKLKGFEKREASIMCILDIYYEPARRKFLFDQDIDVANKAIEGDYGVGYILKLEELKSGACCGARDDFRLFPCVSISNDPWSEKQSESWKNVMRELVYSPPFSALPQGGILYRVAENSFSDRCKRNEM